MDFIEIGKGLVVRADHIRYVYQREIKHNDTDSTWKIVLCLDGPQDPYTLLVSPTITYATYQECAEQMAKVTAKLLVVH